MRMNVTDENLALAAANGDPAAFSALIKNNYDRIFGLVFRLTGRHDLAEDLCHDICASLPVKLGSFRGEAKFSTWLYRVVVNAVHDQRRRAGTRAKAAASWGELEIERRQEAEEAAEARKWLRSAMKTLPDDLRETLAVVLDEAVTHAAAGEILGVSEGTVSWRMSEIRSRLKALKDNAT